MNYRIEGKRRKNQGSISLEAALLLPVMLGVLLFFISLLQIAAARNLLELSVIRTADEMCRWAPVYRNTLLKDLRDKTLSELGSGLDAAIQAEESSLLGNILNYRKISGYSVDFIYGIAAQTLCGTYIADDPLVKNGVLRVKDLNLYQSNFFHNNTDGIRITGTCLLDTYLPFPVKINFTVYCQAWGGGRAPQVSPETEEKSSVIWEENNFTRGKILRQMYGGNLPESFPVIAAFENGTAVMIKSLNHTMPSYQNSGALEKTVREMIDTLASFTGAEYGGIAIRKEEILQRKLILILPENEFSHFQEAAIRNVMRYSMVKFVVLDLQRYQKV